MAELRFQDNHTTIYLGNSLHMAELPDNSVHCVVSSPPYWGQRVYKGAQELDWGGDEGCVHKWGDELVRRDRGTLHGANAKAGNTLAGVSGVETRQGQFCQKCGAWRGAYGLEPTPEMWIDHTLMFLREIRRVLRKDGTVWFNVDDKRWGGKGQSGSRGAEYQADRHEKGESLNTSYQTLGGQGITKPGDARHSIIKPLDLCLIPQRLAIACQEDGWYVRSVVMWEKPNPMPESVNAWRWERCRVKVKPGNTTVPQDDRERGKASWTVYSGQGTRRVALENPEYGDCPGCPKCEPNGGLVLRKGSWRATESYETILMLTKSDKYFADQEAVREAANPDTQRDSPVNAGIADGNVFNGDRRQNYEKGRHKVSSRNLRDVWRFPTQAYGGAHFATFPEKLPEICIKASTSERGVCPKCGAQWARVIKPSPEYNKLLGKAWADHHQDLMLGKRKDDTQGHRATADYETLGWRPTCNCDAGDPISATVLDPFVGTGTTLYVAKRLGRRGVGYDISEEYVQMAIARTKQGVLL